MSLARHSSQIARSNRSSSTTFAARSARNRREHRSSRYRVSSVAHSTVKPFQSPSKPLPIWLRSLLWLQQGSSVVTLGLISATLTLYAFTVYAPRLWSQEYDQLQKLQREERELTATNETLKNQIAQQAQRPDTGLVPSKPSSAIFLSPAPVPPLHKAQSPVAQPNLLPPTSNVPLAY